jgi:hypothetical protein
LRLHGHGVRERQVRGPRGPDEPAALIGIAVRRYRCTQCRAVTVVVPRELRARRLYSAVAIGLALALWGLVGATSAEVRRRVSPSQQVGETAALGWASLRRWARAVGRQKLVASAPRAGPGATLRQVAAGAAQALAGHADPASRGLSLAQRAFLGAAHAA